MLSQVLVGIPAKCQSWILSRHAGRDFLTGYLWISFFKMQVFLIGMILFLTLNSLMCLISSLVSCQLALAFSGVLQTCETDVLIPLTDISEGLPVQPFLAGSGLGTRRGQ